MSAVKKTAVTYKEAESSSESSSDSEDEMQENEYFDDQDEFSEVEDSDDPEESELTVAAKVIAKVTETVIEPLDLELLSEIEQTGEEELLVSKDALSIHTSPYLTKYEYTKVLALRAQQILTGAPPTVLSTDFPDKRYPIDPWTIAMMELKMSRLPLIIGRRLPNNTIIRIPVHALLIPE